MKILYLDHPEADFLSAQVFIGLRQELGEDVVDWPWMPHFHGQTYEGPVPASANGSCSPYTWMPQFSGTSWPDEEVFDRIREFDLVLLASPRTYNTERLRTLTACVGRSAFELAMMDGEDYTTLRWDLIEEFRPSTYFKLSLAQHPYEVWDTQTRERLSRNLRIVCCPLATTFVGPVSSEKTVDVCFLGGGNWRGHRREGVPEDRELLKPMLERMLCDEFPDKILLLGNVRYEEYAQALASSRVAVCVGGHGIEPVRTYEAMSCVDTLVVREEKDHLTPWPLVNGQTCLTFRSHDEIPKLCRAALTDENKRQEIAKRGNSLIWQHYTPRSRARQILSVVGV